MYPRIRAQISIHSIELLLITLPAAFYSIQFHRVLFCSFLLFGDFSVQTIRNRIYRMTSNQLLISQ